MGRHPPLAESPENKIDRDSFEPADNVKGDVSRMLFYMDVRYQGDVDSKVGNLSLIGTSCRRLAIMN
ncbi:endonuclease [Candidatus Fukatsuia symbiotica]|uniref:endonuclease n=1 Tax=Candidatus Fukatsuia TaxID=1927833 RepID=UPI000935296A|nr:endonuclease [Candidatus Fukatsuia symbiotica]